MVFVLCLLAGVLAVAWATRESRDAAQAQARAEARALASIIESELNQAFAGVELLGARAPQNGGAFFNFQAVGTELLAAHPDLGFLAWEPGGVVSEVVPRAGHERLLGIDVLKNPAQHAFAQATRQARVLTAAGPFTLPPGQPGLIARLPLFQRTGDGQQLFRGFVSGSILLPKILARAGLDRLTAQGYEYQLYAPGGPGRQALVILPQRKLFALNDAVNQPVRVRNLAWRLALRPRAGWSNSFKAGLELVAVVVVSGLFFLAARRWQARLSAAEGAKSSGHQTELQFAAEKAQLEESLRRVRESAARSEAGLKQAESRVDELQAQLAAAVRASDEAVRSKQVELDRAHEDLHKGRQIIQELKARAEEAARAEPKAVAAAQARLQQEQATTAELERRLELAARVAKESAELNSQRVKGLEERNQALAQRLRAAEQKVSQLTGLLRAARAEVSDAPAGTHGPAEKAAAFETTAAQHPTITTTATSAAASTPPTAVPFSDPKDNPAAEAGDAAEVAQSQPRPESPSAVPDDPRTKHPAVDSEPAEAPAGQPSIHEAVPGGRTQKLSTKKLRGERNRRNNQMDLFEGSSAARETQKASETELRPESPGRDPVAVASKNSVPPDRRHPESPPVNIQHLRKAVNEILPLLADQDPGAKDCFAANRATFRSAFSAEAYVEFEQSITDDSFGPALEQLRRTAKKHGLGS